MLSSLAFFSLDGSHEPKMTFSLAECLRDTNQLILDVSETLIVKLTVMLALVSTGWPFNK